MTLTCAWHGGNASTGIAAFISSRYYCLW